MARVSKEELPPSKKSQSPTPKDQPARDAARFTLDANVVVEAGAGTGKTTLLTDRLLFLLLAGPKKEPLPIHTIVALTFTEKAAGEIKLRLSDRLSELASHLAGEPLADAARERAQRTMAELQERFVDDDALILVRARAALEDLDKAQIGTIHSFAAHLLRLYPLQAGVDPGFSVDEGEGFEELFASEWARWLDNELGERPPRKQPWLDVLALCSLEDLEALGRALCSEKLDLDRAAQPDAGTADWLDTLAHDLADILKTQPKPKGSSKIEPTITTLTHHLKELAKAARADDPPLPKAISTYEATSSWPKGWDEKLEPLYDEAKAVVKAASAGSEALLRRAGRLLVPFARSFRRIYTRRGLVSFDGLLLKARDLVRDHSEVREELKKKFAALLIDEFQDTDPLQGELLLFLAEAPERRAKHWEDVRLGAGRLFVVGDPKQSIYRFRGADIAAYQSFTRHVLRGQGALNCDLAANFRSPASILDPINSVFETLMVEAEGLQAPHKALEPGRGSGSALPTAVEMVAISSPTRDDAPYNAEAVQRAEAGWISSWIIENCGPGHQRRYKDVAVLLRASTPLPVLLDTFKGKGIPYAVELERYFYGAQEILDFLNLLRSLDDPGDRAALAGLLRSPLCGADDRGLYELARGQGLNYFKEPLPAGLPREQRQGVERLYALLRQLRSRVGRVPLGELVHAVLDETPLLEVAAAAYHGQQTVSNLLKFGRLAAEASEGRGETLREFIERIGREMRDSGREGESPLADEHLDAVRIMTIHKAKGLEFPVVFLTNASSGRLRGGTDVSLHDWGSQRVGLALPGLGADSAMARQQIQETVRQDHETVRLLYVAMTRAKELLFILGKEKGDKNAYTSRLAAAGIWPDGAAAVGARRSPVDAAPALETVSLRKIHGARALPSEKHLGALWRQRAKSRDAALGKTWTSSPTDYLREKPKPRPHDEAPLAVVPGAYVGQLCHRVLQHWDFVNGGDLHEAVQAAGRALERLEPSGDWAAIREEGHAVLEKFLGSKAARELAHVEILGRELPFVRSQDGAVLRGSIDLLYRHKGKVVVADYKTDRLTPKDAAAVKSRYEPQGKAYCETVERSMGLKDVGFRLIFLRAPEL